MTDRAAIKVRALQEEIADDSKILRIFVEAGGCSGLEYGMSFDEVKDSDKKLESEGVSFVVDEASLIYLENCVVDFDDGLTGKGFEIRNPNAKATCGCGKSFN